MLCTDASSAAEASWPSSPVRPVIVGGWGPPVLACVRSWGRRGLQPGVVAVQSRNEPTPNSVYLADGCRLPRRLVGTEAGIHIVADFVRRFRATGITCVEESLAAWMQKERKRLPHGVALWMPPHEALQNLLDKRLQIKAALKVGLAVLPTALIEPPGHSTPRLSYPLCLRPALPGIEPSFKVKIVASEDDLHQWLRSVRRFPTPLIAQPFKNLPNLVVHGSRTQDGFVMGLQGFLVQRKFQGVTLALMPLDVPPNLERECCTFLEELNVTGPFHFEFLWEAHTRTAWFLEINNRLGGTTAKVLALGYDEPGYVLQSFGVAIPNLDGPSPLSLEKASSRQALLKYLAFALLGRLTPLDYPIEPRSRSLAAGVKGLFRYRDDVWAWDDVVGSVNLYWANVKPKLMKLLGH